MAKILLVGAPGIAGVPNEVIEWLRAYGVQGHEFILGDTKTGDAKFHRTLSSLGLIDKSTIYTMNTVVENPYDLPIKKFNTLYDADTKQVLIEEDGNPDDTGYVISGVEKEMDIEHNREWYEFRDKRLINDCVMAILVLNTGEQTKRVQSMIMGLNIRNKPCYTFMI